MKLENVTINNFRCYRDEITISVDELTTLIGKNDIGKSSILDALDFFFNNTSVKIEPADANIYGSDKNIVITCEFSDLPEVLTLDAGAETTLSGEYLLSDSGSLVIRKVYDCSRAKVQVEIFIVANHPTAKGAEGLLELKEKELQKIVKENDIEASLKGNPGMRKAIWKACSDLMLAEVVIPVSKPKEDSKRIWQQIEQHLPLYALFRSDRNSKDSDGEVQNPMKEAITAALADVRPEIERIEEMVRQKASEIADRTLEAMKNIDPKLASDLSPTYKPPTPAKWKGLFSIGMDTDEGIPLNKRGSGVRRMILVSFFMAEANRLLRSISKTSVIYAIEEPETSQHPRYQKILLDSFKSISEGDGHQLILTTHSPGFAAELPVESIRYLVPDPKSRLSAPALPIPLLLLTQQAGIKSVSA